MQWAMEGQGREEVKGVGKDGGGGSKRNKSPTTAMTKSLPLLCPPIEVTINGQWWQPDKAKCLATSSQTFIQFIRPMSLLSYISKSNTDCI